MYQYPSHQQHGGVFDVPVVRRTRREENEVFNVPVVSCARREVDEGGGICVASGKFLPDLCAYVRRAPKLSRVKL